LHITASETHNPQHLMLAPTPQCYNAYNSYKREQLHEGNSFDGS